MGKTSASLSTNEMSNSTNEDRQAGFVDQLAKRVRERAEAKGISYSQIVAAVGASSSAVANYWTGKRPWPAEHLPTIADLLSTNVDALMGRSRTRLLADADQADWIEVPEYSLLEIDEHGKLDPIATTMMRKDWLYSTLGDTSGIWVSRLFARYDPLDIDYGATLFCKDHKAGERLAEGLYYLFRTNGEIIMAPYTSRDTGAPGDAVHRRDIGKEDDQYEPVARVIGQLARPI